MKTKTVVIFCVSSLAVLGFQKPWDQVFREDVAAPEGSRFEREIPVR